MEKKKEEEIEEHVLLHLYEGEKLHYKWVPNKADAESKSTPQTNVTFTENIQHGWGGEHPQCSGITVQQEEEL